MKELYVILDAKTSFEEVFLQAKQALMGGVDKIQLVHSNAYTQADIALLIELCHNYEAMLLFHENLEYAIENDADGVHFDQLPEVINKASMPDDFVLGLTVGNNTNQIEDAVNKGIDYISFCSLYPSNSVQNCEIVDPEIVKDTSNKYDLPIYVAGGIKMKHLQELTHWPIAGIAMISEVLESEDITSHVKEIKKILGYDAG